MATVIVFGPTGNIGSVAALTAHEKGAKVVLAMRDTQKPVPGLRREKEQAGGFERIQADLTKPDTVAAAIQKTGAKRAFIYVAHGTPDHMKSTLTAMKSAGIDFVVLLSSYTVHGEKRDFTPRDMIPFMHAQVEVSLDEVYGEENYVAVRPGGFATNILRFKDGIKAGDVRLYQSPLTFDWITPGDMGRVSGTILVEGAKNGQRKVYLYGPQESTQTEALKVVGKALGREIKVTGIDEEEAREQFKQNGFPPPLVEYMLRILSEVKSGSPSHPQYEEGVKNVELYTGKPSAGFEEWVRGNKDLFGILSI